MRKNPLLLSILLSVALLAGLWAFNAPMVGASDTSTRAGFPQFWVVDLSGEPGVGNFQGYSNEGSYTFRNGGHTVLRLGGAPAFEIHYPGADPESLPIGDSPFSGKAHFYSGNADSGRQENLSIYRALHYPDLYEGIDLHWSFGAQGLKSTYVARPDSSPERIRWSYQHALDGSLTPSGAIRITIPCVEPTGCTLQELPPTAWQVIEGRIQDVQISYKELEDGSFGFELGKYDPALDLRIDPTIESSVELTGPGQVQMQQATVDPDGNLILAGDVRGGALSMAPVDRDIGLGGLVRYRRDTRSWEVVPSNLDVSRATSLFIDPSDENVFYAATRNDGIHKSLDGGQTWTAMNEGLEKTGFEGSGDDYPTIRAVTINPENSDELYLLLQSKGLYGSTNGGDSWDLLSDTFQLGSISQLIVSRKNPQILFAAGGSQLFRSEDNGQTWDSLPESHLYRCLVQMEDGTLLACWSDAIRKSTDDASTWETIYRNASAPPSQLAVHSEDPQKIAFMGFNALSAQNAQVFLSSNGGNTWTAGVRLPQRAEVQFTFDPSSENDLWYTADFGAAQISDNGNSYQPINEGLPSTRLCCQAVNSSGDLFAVAQEDWDSFVLKLTPDGQDILSATYFGGAGDEMLKTLALYAGSVYIAGTTASHNFPVQDPYDAELRHGQSAYLVWLSADGAIEYSTYVNSREPGSLETEDLVIDSQGRPVLMGSNLFFGVDISTRLFVIRFTPDGQQINFERLIGGDDNVRGVWSYGRAVALDKADNIYVAGYSNSRFFPLVRPLQDQLAVDRTPSVFGGDGVIVRLAGASGEITWSTYLGGNGAEVIEALAFDPSGRLIAAGITTSGNLPGTESGFQPEPSGGLFTLADDTWTARNGGLPMLDIQSVAVDPENPSNLVIAVRKYGVYYSRNGGESWNPSTLSEDAPQGVTLFAAGRWMMAGDPSTIFLSEDGGQTWNATTFDNPGFSPPNPIYLIPREPLQLFAGVVGSGIVRSIDGGMTWQATNFIDQTPTRVGQIETFFDDEQILTAVGDRSAFRSTDGGETWALIAEIEGVEWLTHDPHHRGTIYALTLFDIYRSTDYGLTWELFQDKSSADDQLLIDPNEPDLFYLVSSSGTISRSSNGGTTWDTLPELTRLESFFVSTDTGSIGYGVASPTQDGFVSMIDVDTNVVEWTTYLGQRAEVELSSLAIDPQGAIYLAGQTKGDFPLVDSWEAEPRGGSDAFIAKLSNAGDELLYSTLLGREDNDTIRDIAWVGSGRILAVGNLWMDDLDQELAGFASSVVDATPTTTPTGTTSPTATQPAGATSTPPAGTPTLTAGARVPVATTDTTSENNGETGANPGPCLGGLLPLVLAGTLVCKTTVEKRKSRRKYT